ncbi:hypothetical protein ACC738_38555, partial [Rhizobium ruizarguesonis]
EYGRIWSQLGSRAIEELIYLPWMRRPVDAEMLTHMVETDRGRPAGLTERSIEIDAQAGDSSLIVGADSTIGKLC